MPSRLEMARGDPFGKMLTYVQQETKQSGSGQTVHKSEGTKRRHGVLWESQFCLEKLVYWLPVRMAE